MVGVVVGPFSDGRCRLPPDYHDDDHDDNDGGDDDDGNGGMARFRLVGVVIGELRSADGIEMGQ